MRNKIIVGCTVIISNFIFQSAAYSIPTKWEIVNASLSDLIHSGWQLQGVSYNRVASQNSFSPGGTSIETYVFSLTKNGQYIVCTMDNPVVPVATSAGCRKIS
jgi:hypothetical protein